MATYLAFLKHPVNLIALLNPAHDHKIEVAMFNLAKGNAFIDVVSPVVLPLIVALGFARTLNPHGLSIWLLLMLCALPAGLLTYWVLHPTDKFAEPTVMRLQAWRKINLLSLFVNGLFWGGIGFLFDTTHAIQNAVFLLIFLTTITIGGSTFGVHSLRAYFLMVAFASLPLILVNLPNGFAGYAPSIALLIAVYFIFHVRLAINARNAFINTIMLQLKNEQLLLGKMAIAQQIERERIYRDLHDDVGAKLLGLAISAQRANLPHEAELARSALQDLRDVVSRSAQTITRFDYLMADLRAETEQRTLSAGLSLQWNIPKAEIVLPVNSSAALHLSRLLREAVSNVLRHASASYIQVSLEQEAGRMLLIVRDDGVGLPETALKANRGMNSMRARASILDGKVTWESLSPCGCKVAIAFSISHLTLEPTAQN